MDRSERGAALAGACLLGVLAWLSDKAYTIDDPLFLWLGNHLQTSPLDFFGFSVNWDGHLRPMYEVTRNPPLAGYYIAAAGSLIGMGERSLHLAFAIPALAAAWGTWRIALRLCADSRAALEATVLACASPVFLVSSTSVMSDTTMLAFWVWAIVLWLDGLHEDRPGRLWAAGLLTAAAGLTKYFGFALVPLLGAYALCHVRERGEVNRVGLTVLPLALPILVAIGYEALTASLYGTGLLFDAARFASDWRSQAAPAASGRILLGLAFAGGCSISALLFTPLLWRGRWLALGALALLAALFAPGTLLGWAAPGELAQVRLLSVQLVLFTLGGLSLLALVACEARRSLDAETVLLGSWVVGTLVFAAGLNWTNNGRSNLAMAPAAGILIVRRLGHLAAARAAPRESEAGTARGRAFLHAGALASAIVIGLAVAQADARWANDVRGAAREATTRFLANGEPAYFWGRWGWQFYLQQAGARPIEYGAAPIATGSLLLEPTNNYTLPRSMGPPAVALLAELEHATDDRTRWVHTASAAQGAGFYDSRGELLPYVFGHRADVPRDRYRVWRAQQPLRFRQRPGE